MVFLIKVQEHKYTRRVPQHNKGILHKAHRQHQLKWRKSQCNFTEIRSKIMLPILSVSTQHNTGILSQANKETEEISSTQIEQKKSISLLADGMLEYTSVPKNCTGKLLCLINFQQGSEYKLIHNKLVTLLYRSSKRSAKKIMQQHYSQQPQVIYKILEFTLNKQMEHSMIKNIKIVKKESEENIKRWGNLCSYN